MKWLMIILLVVVGFLSGMIFYLLGQVNDLKKTTPLIQEVTEAREVKEVINDDFDEYPLEESPVMPAQDSKKGPDRYLGDKIDNENVPSLNINNPRPI